MKLNKKLIIVLILVLLLVCNIVAGVNTQGGKGVKRSQSSSTIDNENGVEQQDKTEQHQQNVNKNKHKILPGQVKKNELDASKIKPKVEPKVEQQQQQHQEEEKQENSKEENDGNTLPIEVEQIVDFLEKQFAILDGAENEGESKTTTVKISANNLDVLATQLSQEKQHLIQQKEAQEAETTYLFRPHSESDSVSSKLNDKLLPGRELFIQGQRKRGYHLSDPASNAKHPRTPLDYTGGRGMKDSFVYRGGDVDMELSVSLLTQSASEGNHRAMFVLGLISEIGEAGAMNYTRAAEWYHKAATYGNPDAQHALGFLYAAGKGVVMDEAKSILYHSFAARAGHMVSKLSLAYRYLYGHGTEKNCQKSAKLYEEVAKQVIEDHELRGFGYQIHASKITEDFQQEETTTQDKNDIVDYFKYSASIGDPNALVTMANLYLQGGLGVNQDFRVAFKYYHEAAELSYPAGIAGMGFMYSKGYDVEQDNKTAVTYFKKAQNLGHVGAQTNLAEMYLHGYGVDQNQAHALHLFTDAAEKSDVDATTSLGKMYADGIFVTRDINKAFQYFSFAAQQGNLVATFHLARLNLYHSPNPTQACSSSVVMYKKVAEKGPWSMILTQAQDLYEEGDEERALLFFEKAAEMGLDIAQNNAAWMYDKRIGLTAKGDENEVIDEKDADEQAFKYYQYSAEQKNGVAHLKLGDYYYYGKGVESSIEMAVEEYQQAAALQDSQALFNLGYMHQFGKGRNQDLFLAKRYYDLSLQHQANAYIPVYLALCGLFFHFAFFYIYSFFNPSVSFSSSQSSSKIIDFYDQANPQANSNNPGSSNNNNNNFDDELYPDNSNEQFSYDGLIIICLMVLGYLVLRRQRIILGGGGNNNRQQQQRPQ